VARRRHRAKEIQEDHMNKILFAVILGAVLGFVDGLTAAYEFGFGMKVLTIGGLSSIKSVVVGFLVGILARWVKNKMVLAGIGLVLALGIAYPVAIAPDADTGQVYFMHIMLTGGLVGLIVGYATAVYGERSRTAAA
jgi:hypothetical protein